MAEQISLHLNQNASRILIRRHYASCGRNKRGNASIDNFRASQTVFLSPDKLQSSGAVVSREVPTPRSSRALYRSYLMILAHPVAEGTSLVDIDPD